jgi:hypothetical protein
MEQIKDNDVVRDGSVLSTWLIISCNVIVAFVIITICLIWPTKHLTLKSIVISLGSSILASSIFYFLYARFAEKHVIRSVTRDTMEYAHSLYLSKFGLHLPTKVYPGTDKINKYFNKDIENRLITSKIYLEKGVSGKFSSYRIHMLKNKNIHIKCKEVKLLLLNPTANLQIKIRANSDLKGNKTEKDINEQMEKIKSEIYETIVALFDACGFIDQIEIGFYTECPFFRFEILDNGIYLSFLTDGDGISYPPIYFFEEESVNCASYYSHFYQTLKISTQFIFKEGSPVSDLEKCLKEMKCPETLTIDILRKNYQNQLNINANDLSI